MVPETKAVAAKTGRGGHTEDILEGWMDRDSMIDWLIDVGIEEMSKMFVSF